MDPQRSVDIDNDRGNDSDTEIVTMQNDDDEGENPSVKVVQKIFSASNKRAHSFVMDNASSEASNNNNSIQDKINRSFSSQHSSRITRFMTTRSQRKAHQQTTPSENFSKTGAGGPDTATPSVARHGCGSNYSRESGSQQMWGFIQHQRDRYQPMLHAVNKKLMNVSLDNIRLTHQNSVLLELITSQKMQLESKNTQFT